MRFKVDIAAPLGTEIKQGAEQCGMHVDEFVLEILECYAAERRLHKLEPDPNKPGYMRVKMERRRKKPTSAAATQTLAREVRVMHDNVQEFADTVDSRPSHMTELEAILYPPRQDASWSVPCGCHAERTVDGFKQTHCAEHAKLVLPARLTDANEAQAAETGSEQ